MLGKFLSNITNPNRPGAEHLHCGVAYLPRALECHGTHTKYNYKCPVCGKK